MTTVNLGSMSYNIDVKDKDALDGLTKVGEQTKKLSKEFEDLIPAIDKSNSAIDKTSKALDKTSKEIDKSSSRTKSLSGELDKASDSLIDTAINVDKTGASAKKTESSIESLSYSVKGLDAGYNRVADSTAKAAPAIESSGRAAKQAEKNTGALGQTAQNAAYQIQDFTAQVTLGTSPVLALSQQLPQLLGGLGATGAGIGAVVAILGGLYLALGDSTSASEKFEKAIEQAKATLTLSADGVAEYSDEMKKLAAISNTLAEIKLASTLANLTTGVKDGAKALQDITTDATNTINLFRDFDDVVKSITGKRAGAEGFEDAESAIKKFNFAVAAFVAQRTPENVRDLEDALNGLVSAGANSTKTGRELVTSAVDLIGQFREAEITAEQLKKGLEGLTDESGKSRESIEKMVESLQLQADTIGMTERETAIYVASLKGANDAEVESINLAYDAIEAYEKKQQTIKDNAKALDEYEAAIWRQMNAEAAQFEQEQRRKQQASGFASGIANRDNPQIKELEQLAGYYQQKLITTQEYEAAITQIIKEQADKRQRVEAQRNSLILGSTSQFFDAASGLAETFAGEQSTAYKVLFGISKAFAIAQAGLNLSTAISQASTLPWPTNIPAMAQAAASGASILSAIQSAAYSGSRNYGGGVGYGGNYQVAEGGRTELYIPNRGNPMLMGSKGGQVVSNSDLMSAFSGGGNAAAPVVNIYEAPPGTTADVQKGPDDRYIVNVVVGNINNRGGILNAITRNTTASSKVV